MTNEIKLFKHEVFGELEILMVDGKEYFPATEVAKKLGYSNPHDALSRHCKKDGVAFHEVIDNLGRPQQTKFINEGNLYRLIVKSKLPEAEKFESWVFDEVLPTLRKTGGYINNSDQIVNTYFGALDETQKLMIKGLFVNIEEQQKQISLMKPKSEYFDALVERNLLINFRDTAKELKVKQKVLIDFLLDSKYLYRDKRGKLKPYAEYVPELFEIKEFKNKHTVGNQTLTTPKGRETFRLLLSSKKLG